MKTVTSEMIEKARKAKTPEELAELAKANGMELTEESAKAYFEQLHAKSGELTDDELENVAGGGCYSDNRLVVTVGTQKECFVCKRCGVTHNSHDTMYDMYGYQHFCLGRTFATINCCNECKYCVYEKGLWLCNNPKNRK